MRFRKKPVEIEAIQYDGFNWESVAMFLKGKGRVSRQIDAPVYIDTLEGRMRADKGDWIVRGVKGEFYPVKPDIFEQTYEAVE